MDIVFFYKVVATIFGAMIGSFLNAVIYRLPRKISFVAPRSKCPHCSKVITWYENIPVLSFLFLRGKCSNCKTKISFRYPFVEMLIAVSAYFLFPSTLSGLTIGVFAFNLMVLALFVVHIFIDLDFKILPDSINLILGILFFSYSVIFQGWQFLILGGVVGFLIPFLVTYAFYKIKGQIGLGGGDIKLYTALGLILGPIGVIHNIFLSCFLGSIIGIVLILFKKMTKDNPMPFGPSIILVAIFQLFFPGWYGSLMSFIL
ncbi:MAG: prepilin peptidase [Bacteriovoracaceae bacterium]